MWQCDCPFAVAAQAVLGEFEQREEQLAAQLAGGQAAQRPDVPRRPAAGSGGCSQGSADGNGVAASAAGSRPASEERSRHSPAALAAGVPQAGDFSELPRNSGSHAESKAASLAKGDCGINNGDGSSSPPSSRPAASGLDQAAANLRGDLANAMPLQADVAERPPGDTADPCSCEHGADAAEAGRWLAPGPVAAPAEDCIAAGEDCTAAAAHSPGSRSDAMADDGQHDTAPEVVPLPWVGSRRDEDCAALPAIQDSGLPDQITLAADASVCPEDACMPVPMVSACSSPPAVRPVKRARWSELQHMRYSVEDGTAAGVDSNDVSSGRESAGVDVGPSGNEMESQSEAQQEDAPVQQLFFKGASGLREEQRLVVPPSSGTAACGVVLPTVETLTERLEGLSSLVMGRSGGSQVGSQGSPSAVVGTALQGAARYVPWEECSPA